MIISRKWHINLPPLRIRWKWPPPPFKSKEGIGHHTIIRLEMATASFVTYEVDWPQHHYYILKDSMIIFMFYSYYYHYYYL